MAKVGTAHIEIKPVLNEEALGALVQRIEDAITAGVERALARHYVATHPLSESQMVNVQVEVPDH